MEVFLGQLLLVPYNFAPSGFAFCQGQIMSINQNAALFSLLGTQYGGNGTSTFALPDLRGRTPIGFGQGPGLSNYVMGETAGVENLTLLTANMPPHTHGVAGTSVLGNAASPVNALYAAVPEVRGRPDIPFYVTSGSSPATLNPESLTPVGNTLSHPNLMPYLALNWIIAITGIFPQRP